MGDKGGDIFYTPKKQHFNKTIVFTINSTTFFTFELQNLYN